MINACQERLSFHVTAFTLSKLLPPKLCTLFSVNSNLLLFSSVLFSRELEDVSCLCFVEKNNNEALGLKDWFLEKKVLKNIIMLDEEKKMVCYPLKEK